MKENKVKIHLILKKGDSNQIRIGNLLIKGILCEKLFGVKFDHKLALDQNVKSFGKKVKAKLKTLARVVPYIILAKKILLMNSFFAEQLYYCPLIWMIDSCFSNN